MVIVGETYVRYKWLVKASRGPYWKLSTLARRVAIA